MKRSLRCEGVVCREAKYAAPGVDLRARRALREYRHGRRRIERNHVNVHHRAPRRVGAAITAHNALTGEHAEPRLLAWRYCRAMKPVLRRFEAISGSGGK